MMLRSEMLARLQELEQDPRLTEYKAAHIEVNAILAIEQISMRTEANTLRRCLGLPSRQYCGHEGPAAPEQLPLIDEAQAYQLARDIHGAMDCDASVTHTMGAALGQAYGELQPPLADDLELKDWMEALGLDAKPQETNQQLARRVKANWPYPEVEPPHPY